MENSTIKFLLDASMILRRKNNSLACGNIISQLRQKYLAILAEASSHNGSFVPSEVCKVCGNAWLEGFYGIRILGHNCEMRKHKMKNKLKFALSGSKKKFMSFYEKRKDNVMVKRCCVCNSITKYGMNKPHLKTEDDLSFDNNLNCVENQISVKKKRKRKSTKQSFAGLSAAAVLHTRSSLQMKKNECTSNATKKFKATFENNSSIATTSSRLDMKDAALFSKTSKSVGSFSSVISPETESPENHESSLNIKILKSKLKKKKLKNVHKQICIEKKSQFKKKKSFVSEFISLL